MASELSKRVWMIENSISLISILSDRLRFLQQPMPQLISQLAQLEQFSHTQYLQSCNEEMKKGAAFPQSWRKAMAEQSSKLAKAQSDVLLPLGEILGCTDLDSQLSALADAKNLLENRLIEARAYKEKHSKLYRSMGVLSGVAVVIILL